jgi:hypothetical protein
MSAVNKIDMGIEQDPKGMFSRLPGLEHAAQPGPLKGYQSLVLLNFASMFTPVVAVWSAGVACPSLGG